MSSRRPTPVMKRVVIGIAAVFLPLFFPHVGHAMTISPPVLDFTLNPGDTVSDVVQVYNEEEVPFKITPEVVNFYGKSGDETSGTPEFYPAKETRNGYELAPWIALMSGEQIASPKARIDYPISISVPKDAQPGSHFGAVQILASDPKGEPGAGNVGINRGASVLVFVRVNGVARDEMTVSRFGGDRNIYPHLPVAFDIRLDNTGNTHLRPTGDVFIKDMLGRQVAALPVNPGPDFRTVLPGSARRFAASWFKKKLPDSAGEYQRQIKNFGFGRYDATLVMDYGPDNRILTAEYSFWVLPWLAIATITASAIVSAILLAYGIKRYNRLVIRRHEAMMSQSKK